MNVLARRILPVSLVLAWLTAAVGQEPAGNEPDSPAAAQAAADSIDARITSLEGDVTVSFHDGDGDVPAEKDMPLEEGDRVKTGPDSGAEVGLDGDSVLQLGPDSEFAVTSVDREKSAFTLTVGSLLSKVRSLLSGGGRMDIRTPTAVASVRGTEFGVEQEADGPGHVAVFDEGQVVVGAPGGGGGETTLRPNQEASIAKGFSNWSAIRARPLERFASRRAAMKRVIQRAAKLRRNWRKLSRENRARRRRMQFQRQRNLRQKLLQRRQQLRQQRRGRQNQREDRQGEKRRERERRRR